MWVFMAPVTITIPWEHLGAHSSLPAVSVPPRDPSRLSWEQHGGCWQSPCLALPMASPTAPAALCATKRSWSSSRSPGRCPRAPQQVHHNPPATLPVPLPALPPAESPGLALSPNPVPPQGLGAWHRWFFKVWDCLGGNIHFSRMLLSTRYIFSCIPLTPCVLAAGL